jgi:hypothetical protein
VQGGFSYCPHYLGGGIGLLASAHLLAAVGGDGMLEVDSNENPLRDELCGPLREVRDGHVLLGGEPGLGAAPDLRALRRFRVSRQAVSGANTSGWRKILGKLPFRRATAAGARGKHRLLKVIGAGERYEPAKHYMRGPGPKAREAIMKQNRTRPAP